MPLIKRFLISRGLAPDFFPEASDSMFYPGNRTDMKFRIIVPVTLDNMIVGFVGRDITGLAYLPYYTEGEVKSTLYGLDKVREGEPVVIVEGLIDQWKLGRRAVATLGTGWSREQVYQLWRKKPSKVYILFDSEPETQNMAERLAGEIWFAPCEVLELTEYGDPGEMPFVKARNFMKELI